MMKTELLEEIKKNYLKNETVLSKYATLSKDAIRINKEYNIDEIRSEYSHDTDRIIHALSYTRYLNKTQVFSYSNNDHISKRIVHVQLVSKIARTIGRCLCLNEDLIEAIALGHDIGHTPLGHLGESLLNEISLRELNEMFNHNIQSVRNYMCLENNQTGINLTIQTLDGIMCHNGEMLSNIYKPHAKTKEEFINEYNKCYKDKEILKSVAPMTLEGCVVRISDIIGYIGRDIEDAINIGILDRNDIPKNIVKVLGSNNRKIVNTIIMDIIANSLDKPYIKMSKDVYEAIFELKEFNYKNIYSKANSKEQVEYYRNGMNKLFNKYLNDIKENNKNSYIIKHFLSKSNIDYKENTNPKRIVIDFIAGMTDDYFINEVKKVNKIQTVNTK